MTERKTGTHHRSREKRQRTRHSGKPNPYSGIEGIISKHLLKIIGFVFIIVVAGYSVSSLDKLKGVVKQLTSQGQAVREKVQGGTAVLPEAPGVAAATAVYDPKDILMMAIIFGATTLFFAAVLLFAIRIRRKEIPRIAVIVYYAVAFILARKYGWQIHILFPMILVFSGLVFYSGVKVHSMLAGKWNYLVCWAFFMVWWGLKVMLGGERALLWGLFLYGALFYLMFLYMGAYGGFTGRHKFSAYTEIALVIFNPTLFYLMGITALARFSLTDNAWIFSLVLACINLGLLFAADAAGKKLDPGPYVFPSMVMLSLIFPFIFHASAVILFLAILSCLLLFYSNYSGDKLAVITAFAAIVLMLLVYIKDWVFQYLPTAFLGNLLDNRAMMVKGLIAGLVIFPVMIINGSLVRKLHVDFSKEWFSRRSYQRFFKGVNIIVLYLSGFWVVNYLILVLSGNPDLHYMSWFGYNCLFFIIAIPILSGQKSKFLGPAIGFALFFTLAYPTLIHFTLLNLRNEALQHEHLSRLAFWFHYPVTILFVAELIMLQVYLRKAFVKNEMIIRAFSAWVLLMGLFIVLSEYDHYSIWTGLRRGITIEEIALANRVIPYTFILLGYSAVVLGTGLVSRNRLLRAAGLILLLCTLGKMLYIDVRALTGTTRSVVLFTVGVIVLVLSFMYPRMKRYFRHREHESKGMNKRQHRHSHRKPVSIPGEQAGITSDETL